MLSKIYCFYNSKSIQKLKLRYSLIIIFSTFFHHYVFASAASENPNKPFLSSIPAVLLEPSHEFNPKVSSLTLHPERSAISPFTKKNKLSYTYKIQNNTEAPMVILIPGIGGTANSNAILYLSEVVYKLGYSVITLTSSTHWSFALAASTSGRTGHLPADSSDMYQVIKAIKVIIEEKFQIHPSQWGLIGISYGTLDASFLLAQDLDQKEFKFNFLITINPPLSRSIAIEKVDQYFSIGAQWPKRKKKALELLFINRLLNVNQNINPIDTFNELEHAFPLEEQDLAWLMGDMFRRAILNTAYVGNRLENIPTQSSSDAFHGTMQNYLREKLYKKYYHAKSNKDYQRLENESELSYALNKNNSESMKNKKVILFHGMNDYLSFPEGEFILDQLAVEKFVYSYGGHLGLLSDDKMIKDFQSVLLRLK